jgi:hypothetical protein
MSSTANMMRRRPSVFAGALGSALTAVGVWNFVSPSRLWPSESAPLRRRLSLEVVDNDADVVHLLDRHMPERRQQGGHGG